MSVAKVPPTSCVSPTAVHIWLAPQDTPLRMLRPALGLLGVDRSVHAVPFQTSPSVLENTWPLVCDCPTAVQESADVHDTPLRRLNWNPEGLGVDCRVHVDPFHASAKVTEPVVPTASHELAAEHETAFGAWPGFPAVGCGVQVLPFHTAAFSPAGPWPTASQKLAVTHDTEVNIENPDTVVPADQAVPFQVFTWPKPLTDTQKSTVAQDTACGLTSKPGLDCSVHEVPFHISALGPIVPPVPTASQKLAETQETLSSISRTLLPSSGGGSGAVWILHEVPFHCSTRAVWLPEMLKRSPTASQKLAETQDTEPSELKVAPGGVTARWSSQA